jgi:hypothetical protein
MSVALEVLKKAVEELTKEVKLETPLTDLEKARARALLSAFVREFWNSPLGIKLKNDLEVTATEYGAHLEDVAKEIGLDKRYEEVAKKTAIGDKYRLVWGKPTKGKKG